MFKRFIPKSLYARVALIVILPIFLMQSVITYVFFDRHWDTVTANQSKNVAGQIAMLVDLFAAAPTPAAREAVRAKAHDSLDIVMRFEPKRGIPQKNKLSPFSLYNRTLNRQLDQKLDQDFWFDTRSWPTYVEIRVQTSEGTLAFLPLRDRVFATTGPVFVLWLIGTSLLLGWIAVVFLRNQVKSILNLAAAAEAFGRGRDMPDFRPSGATEVRRAGRAFIAMRERIKRQISQRTTMLAGVSHDLRTPLTRMKLSLAMLPDNEDVAELKRDVEEMQSMISAYLEFASDIASSGEPERFDAADVVREAIDGADPDGVRIAAIIDGPLPADGRPIAFKRAIDNLIGNALRYATRAQVTAKSSGAFIDVIVDDDGPGVPPENYADVFRPFFRLDEARNSHKGGTGLGLSIVRDVARSHGGDVTLSKSPMGGLRASLRIPA
jgi:two-component system osmolarity sensor histidine kinase EnvZ